MPIKKINTKSGFTAVEMLIAMFIFVIIGIAAVTFQLDIFSLNRISNDNLIAQEDARRALKNISSEFRSMSPSNMGAYALVQTATSSITFYNNIDEDSPIEKVRYFLEGTTLKRGTIKPSGTPFIYNPANETVREVIHNIANASSSIFLYYDTNYDGTSEPLTDPVNTPLVRLIKVNIIIDSDPSKSPAPLYMTTQASIRNLKDNL